VRQLSHFTPEKSLFLRYHHHPNSKHSYYYNCRGCETFRLQPAGTRIEEGNQKKYLPGIGPSIPQNCPECGRTHYMGGPIWSDPIHDQNFVTQLLENIKNSTVEDFATRERLLGMITVISEELPNTPFYYDLPAVAKKLHCITPGVIPLRSAILNAGYQVSSTHCNVHALKTDAPPEVMWDIMRGWVFKSPHPFFSLQVSHFFFLFFLFFCLFFPFFFSFLLRSRSRRIL
jgi:tRNA (guanine26-N2/guanine27-N2)-dimethyltransferase